MDGTNFIKPLYSFGKIPWTPLTRCFFPVGRFSGRVRHRNTTRVDLLGFTRSGSLFFVVFLFFSLLLTFHPLHLLFMELLQDVDFCKASSGCGHDRKTRYCDGKTGAGGDLNEWNAWVDKRIYRIWGGLWAKSAVRSCMCQTWRFGPLFLGPLGCDLLRRSKWGPPGRWPSLKVGSSREVMIQESSELEFCLFWLCSTWLEVKERK